MIDAHCHLADMRLASEDEAVMRRAAEAGVRGMMCCGTCADDWDGVLAIGARYPETVSVSLGLHPWYAGGRKSGWLEALEGRLRRNPAAAVGEIGLDHALADFDAKEQEDVFAVQLDLAIGLNRPVSIHCRRAWEPILKVLGARSGAGLRFMVHSFSGSPETMREIVGLGGYVSFSGALTLPNNRKARKVAAEVPPDRILVETDSPDLMPWRADVTQVVNARGRPSGVNEPANLRYVVEKLAEVRGSGVGEVAEMTRRNALEFFAGVMR